MDSSNTNNTEQVKPSLPDFSTLLQDKTFTFVIGAEKKKYTIHVAALKSISGPLGTMMTNGKMEESMKGEAHLPDLEPAVFEDMTKFAYMGLRGIADGISGDLTESKGPTQYRCNACCGTVYTGSNLDASKYPFCGSKCEQTFSTKYQDLLKKNGDSIVYCVVHGCGLVFGLTKNKQHLCSGHQTHSYQTKYPKPEFALMDENSGSYLPGRWFTAFRYGAEGLSHKQVSQLLDQYKPRPSSTCNVGL